MASPSFDRTIARWFDMAAGVVDAMAAVDAAVSLDAVVFPEPPSAAKGDLSSTLSRGQATAGYVTVM